MAEHSINLGHRIHLQNTSILAKQSRWMDRIIREAVEIELVDELETTFLTVFWNDILIRINSVSKVPQKQNMNLSVAVKLIKSLMMYVSEKRDCFEEYESREKEKSHIDDYQDAYKFPALSLQP
jgi:hypothetical protein